MVPAVPKAARHRVYLVLGKNAPSQTVPVLETLEEAVLFILGSSLISFKLISLMSDGRTLWSTAAIEDYLKHPARQRTI